MKASAARTGSTGLPVWTAILARTLLMVLAACASPLTALADTTTQTIVSVEIVDEGRLDVFWESTGTEFLIDSAEPALTSFSSAFATASIQFGISDTRIAGTREGFRIALHASEFSGSVTGATIPANDIVVQSVESADGTELLGVSLEREVVVCTIPSESAVDEMLFSLVLLISLPPDLPTDEYSGSLTLSILPLDTATS